MLDRGLQELLHALTHKMMSCDSSSVKATSAECHCMFWYFTCPYFPRTAHRHRSSNPIRAAFSIIARSASLRRPLTRCSVDLLHLDQFSWTLSNVGGTPRSFHARNYLGLTQVLTLERRAVDSATLSTTGCCRSRSFSSGNHRNSCNKISTFCPQVCYDVHTSKWEFSG